MKRIKAVTALFLLAGAATVALAGEVFTTSGGESAQILQITEGENGVVKLENKEVAVSKVVRLTFGKKTIKPNGNFMVVMINGDRVVGNLVDGDEKGLIIDSETIGKRRISIDNLLAAFNLANVKQGAFIEEKSALDNTTDVVFLKGGQKTLGVVEKFAARDVVIKVEALGSIDLPYEKVLGVKLAPLSKPKPLKGLRATVHLADGSRLSGKLTSYKSQRMKFNWFGTPVELEEKFLHSLYFFGGNSTHLSDLKPSEVVETPFFDKFLYHYQLDHSLVKKQPISLRGKKFFKGVSVHSKTELTYQLDRQYSKFVSIIGIDDETGGKGDVVFAVYGDGKELFRSINITGKTEPAIVSVILDGVKELKLVVDFGKDIDTMDRAVWADAVLVKEAAK